MEFPAVGRRYLSYGTLYYAGTDGYYWSSVKSSTDCAYYLYFDSSNVSVGRSNDKQSGLSVRCVR